MENFFASVAQFDNDVRAARTIDAMKAGLRQGRWMWSAPIGYRQPKGGKSEPSLVPDVDNAALVRLAFEIYAAGDQAKRAVWEEVTAMGLVRPSGKALSIQSFGEMLKNPIYTGRVVSEGFDIDTEGDFEPLVSEEVFARAQAVTRKSRRTGPQRQWDNPDFPLRRTIRCSACGSPITGSWSRGRSRKYAYYRCPRKGCGEVSVRRGDLEDEFSSFLATLSVKPEIMLLMSSILRDVHARRFASVSTTQARLQRRRAQLESQSTRLVSAYLYEDRIDAETFEKKRHRLKREIDKVTDRIVETGIPGVDFDRALAKAEGLC